MRKRGFYFVVALLLTLGLTDPMMPSANALEQPASDRAAAVGVSETVTEPALHSCEYEMTVDVGAGSTLRFCASWSNASQRLGSIPDGSAVYAYGVTTRQYDGRTWAKIRWMGTTGWVNYAWLSDPGSAPDLGSVYVLFDANGGTDCPSGFCVRKDSDGAAAFALPTDKLTRPGYTFLGWQRRNSADQTTHTWGEKLRIGTADRHANDTLVYSAQWKAEQPQTTSPSKSFPLRVTYHENFQDIDDYDWYYPNVVTAYRMGLVNGVSSTSFDPDGNVTVAQAITLACRLHSAITNDAQKFGDAEGAWYQPYLTYAEKNGIVTHGYDQYDRPAKRAEFAELLAAAFPEEALVGINSIVKDGLPDVDENGALGQAIYRLYRAGVLTGSDYLGTFDPDYNISRAQATAIVTRMADPDLRMVIELPCELN